MSFKRKSEVIDGDTGDLIHEDAESFVDEARGRTRFARRFGGRVSDVYDAMFGSGYSSSHSFMDPAEKKAMDAVKVANFVKHMARIHGTDCSSVRFRSSVEKGVRLSPKGGEIILGSDVLDAGTPMATATEIYGGYALMAAERKDNTTFSEFIGRCDERIKATRGKAAKFQEFAKKTIAEVVRDGRCEDSAMKVSPGFSGYIDAAKEHVFGPWVKELTDGWDTMSPRDKAFAQIVGAMRCPDMFTEDLREHVNGIDVFERTSEFFEPIKKVKTSGDLDMVVNRVMRLVETVVEAEPPPPPEGDGGEEEGEGGGGGGGGGGGKSKSKGSSGGGGRGSGSGGGSGGDGSSGTGGGGDSEESEEADMSDFMKDEAERDKREAMAKKVAPDTGETGEETETPASIADRHEELEKAEKEMEEAEAEKGKEDAPMSSSGSLSRISKLSSGMTGDDSGLSAEATKKFDEMTESKFEAGSDHTKGDSLLGDREAGTMTPKIDAECAARYDLAVRIVKPFVAKASSVFRVRKAEETVRSVDKVEGRLNRKRLSHAMISDRLFMKESKFRAVGVSICILLDESGSMGSTSVRALSQVLDKVTKDPESVKSIRGSGITEAFLMAVMIQQALAKVPRVDLHMYSHSSYGGSEENCLVKKFMGGGDTDPRRVGAYTHGAQNYDHMAIKITGDKFLKEAKFKNQLFFILSDGSPCGHSYGGHAACTATKKAGEALERKGMTVVAVGVGGHNPKDLFKRSMAFNGDFSQLIDNVRKVIGGKVLDSGKESVVK